MNHIDESDFVLLIKKKDREAFNFLYENYSGAIYGVILSMLADKHLSKDVLQEVFIKIWTKADQFDPVKGRLYTWILNITKNAAIDKIRSSGKTARIIAATPELADLTPKIDTIGMTRLIFTLKSQYQNIIKLFYFKGHTLPEISELLDMPLGTVKTNLRKGILQLREIYTEAPVCAA